MKPMKNLPSMSALNFAPCLPNGYRRARLSLRANQVNLALKGDTFDGAYRLLTIFMWSQQTAPSRHYKQPSHQTVSHDPFVFSRPVMLTQGLSFFARGLVQHCVGPNQIDGHQRLLEMPITLRMSQVLEKCKHGVSG
jgi:hypothetical protein